MVIANWFVNQIDIYEGLNDETFSKQFYDSTGINSNPTIVAVNDLNNDFHLDIAVANYGTHSIGIFYRFGNGSFKNQIEISTGISRPTSVDLIDMNNDLFIDIIIINYGTKNEIYSKSMTYSTGYDSYPYSLTIGDFNNDIQLDIIVINYNNNKFGVLFGHGNETFDNMIFFSMPYGSHLFSFALADFNHDEKMNIDLINNGTDNLSIYLHTC